MGSAHPSIVPYQAFRAKDREIIIAVGNDQQFQRLCQSLGLEKLSEERRFSTNPQRVRNRQQLVTILSRHLKKQSAAYWNKLLNQNRIPSTPVYKISDVVRDPQIKHRGLFKKMNSGIPQLTSSIKLFKQEKRLSNPAPTLGQDTAQVLRELGYSKRAINRMTENRAG
jgi:crotonobetainyl-CoA:carnitine CoA-transferase CaiB-like acyl-CoA transferase